MYSKNAKITQAVYEGALPVVFTFASSFESGINVVYLFAFFMLLYCVPLFFTSYKLRQGDSTTVKTCILHDIFILLLPFCVSALIMDLIVVISVGAQSWTGMTSLIFIISAVILTPIMWLKYRLDKKFNNRP